MATHIHFVESTENWQKLLPLTYTRPVAELRVGILTLSEKWKKHLSSHRVSHGSAAYLQPLFPANHDEHALHIAAGLLPNPSLVDAIDNLQPGQALVANDEWLASKGLPEDCETIPFTGDYSAIRYPWDIFRLNKQEIEADFDLLTRGRTSADIADPHTRIYGERIFLEEGVDIKSAIINAESGAVYLGKNAVVQEGAIIKGAFALCEGAHVNMGGKMRGDNTIGPYSKVGGEVSNCVLQGYSNKGHDGFLGNAVLGEWCNIGADSNNSNLKNNYTNIKMWDFASGRFKDTGLQFCGLIMGDHSKCGINTMFNTGTTVGVSANIFGSGFPRTIIPSFAWGGANGFSTYQPRRAFETAQLVMERRNKTLTEADKEVLQHIFELTKPQRVWEK